jgi:hypothetical protein
VQLAKADAARQCCTLAAGLIAIVVEAVVKKASKLYDLKSRLTGCPRGVNS